MRRSERRTRASRQNRIADAVDDNWVERYAPYDAQPYLRLSRADRPIGTWLLWLPCLWGIFLAAGATGWLLLDLWLVIGSGIGAFLMRGAGCTWNDIQDRDIDRGVARTANRPLPAGEVTVVWAYIWLVSQALTAFLILITFNNTAIWLGIASLLPVAIYPFAKRFTWWPQAFLGIAFNWGALLLWAAHTGSLTLAPILLYLGAIAWTLHYDTIYAHQDREDDALIGVKSTARLFGDRTAEWLWVFAIVCSLLISAAIWSAGGGILAFVGVAALFLHMASQIRRMDIGDPAICLNLFRETRFGGMALAICFAMDSLL
ncbi:MAG: 4-hydroxybenzoate octaprenyltransferase [Pseudomonadota bacterium]